MWKWAARTSMLGEEEGPRQLRLPLPSSGDILPPSRPGSSPCALTFLKPGGGFQGGFMATCLYCNTFYLNIHCVFWP